MKLALGPVQYYWPRQQLLDFYAAAAEWPVDIIYLGEVVCAKRRPLRSQEWLELAQHLAAAGKEVVLATLTLLEAASELGAVRRLCNNGKFSVEANDMAAVNILAGLGAPFVGGLTLNIYNPATLAVLVQQGLYRWVAPLELGRESLNDLLAAAPPAAACEVFAWGRMPLAWSARCFTARAEHRAKDQCELVCLADPDGRLIHTRDDEPFLVLNGIQTQSALTQNLAPYVADLRAMGISALRLSPQSQNMSQVVSCFRSLLDADQVEHNITRLAALAPLGCCDGYWRGEPGFAGLAESARQA
ncbi:MAG: U32 family peptidase [Gammaproteobacteria bacterium]|jgi:collagenase-like PrtC family protease|nr:U32 family peptidase [Gammaproteobacteria bacterium]